MSVNEKKHNVLTRIQVEWCVQKGPTPVIGTKIEESGRWLDMATPSLPVPEVNCVWRSVLHDSQAAEEIERVVGFHRANRLPLWWLVSPNSSPAHLDSLLLERGLVKSFDAFGLGLRTEAALNWQRQENITVERVTEKNFENYWKVSGKNPSPALHEWTMRMLGGDFGEVALFYASIGGEFVGTSAYRIFGKVSFLMSGFTRPDFRHQGVYREMLRFRMIGLHETGVTWAVTMSKVETSAPILKRLGFQNFGLYKMYTLP